VFISRYVRGGDLGLMFKQFTIAQHAAAKVKKMVSPTGRPGRSTSFTQIIPEEETQADVRLGRAGNQTQ